MTSGTFGQPGIGSSASADRQRSLESKLQADMQNCGSTLYRQTWKPWVTPSGRCLSRLVASARRTSDSGYSGGPTCTANDSTGSQYRYGKDKLKILKLPGVVKQAPWATPAARDWRDGRASQATMDRNSRPLNEQAVHLLGRPRSGSDAQTADIAQLNPEFARWLMGFPTGWSCFKGTETQ